MLIISKKHDSSDLSNLLDKSNKKQLRCIKKKPSKIKKK